MTKRFALLANSGQLKKTDLAVFMEQMLQGSDLMERNLHRAVELVKNFKQVAADQASEQRRSFDLKAVAEEVLDTLSPSLKRYSHRVEMDIAEGIILDSYPGALGQVLINVINNAYLHAFEGRNDGLVRISAALEGEFVALHLRDNGVGMAQAHLDQLFQPFFSTKIGRGGTGLGMTIVENLVSRTLGGSVRVQSELGVGTHIALRIPTRVSAASA